MEISLTGNKSTTVKKLIVDMLDILHEAGIPMNNTHRRLEKMAMACLAVGNIKNTLSEALSSDDEHFLTTREIIAFENDHYGEHISFGSYDDIRRNDLLLPVQAGIVLSSSAFDLQATNNPTRGYSLNPLFANLIRQYGQTQWNSALIAYKNQVKSLKEELERKRNREKIPVRLPSGINLELSFGAHNLLQKAIIEDFLPMFGMGAQVLYVGDTSDKYLYMDRETLKRINFFLLEHEELPDIVAYNHEKNLLFLIEAVHSAGPMSDIRVRKLAKQLEKCTAIPIYITSFMNKKEFRKWVTSIAWETEVWIADNPVHMIHFKGYKFLEIHL
jgi:type II restriction enzyme